MKINRSYCLMLSVLTSGYICCSATSLRNLQTMVELCVADVPFDGTWETDKVSEKLAKLLTRKYGAKLGKCSQLCGGICSHKACTVDMTIKDESCTCITAAPLKICGPSAYCNTDATCSCPTGYKGDPYSTAGCKLDTPIPTIKCKKLKRGEFGVGPKTIYVDMGTTSGTVAISYDFYADSNQLKVKYGPDQKLDTGLVTRKSPEPISFEYSGTSTILEFIISGASSWKIKAAHCP